MTRLADRLVAHAARIMPASRADWARAMRAELAHIPAPLAAMAFALGCVRASYSQRICDAMTLARLTRWTLAAFALFCAGLYLLATTLVVCLKAARDLTPRDLGADAGAAETLRFFQAYPPGRLAILALLALLLSAGAVLLARRRPGALALLASAAAGATLVSVLDLRLVAGADWPLAWSNTWLVPLMGLVPVWWLSRRAPDLKTP